jgi:hypothetical protein
MARFCVDPDASHAEFIEVLNRGIADFGLKVDLVQVKNNSEEYVPHWIRDEVADQASMDAKKQKSA